MTDLNLFELSVMEKLLDGSHPALAILREQLRLAKVKERELTGTGFFIKFKLPLETIRAPIRRGRIHFGDVDASITGLQHGAGFVLFINDGKLEMLEGYSFDEKWPKNIGSFELRYSNPSRALLSKVFE